MSIRPSTSNTGAFFDYPSDASGVVTPYWLASSPGGGHRVRMTGACKRAFLATIEAVMERAVVPATAGDVPPVGADLRAATLDSSGTGALIPLGDWTAPAKRAALADKLYRGCPREEWERLVGLTSVLWGGAAKQTPCGIVFAWQLDVLEYETGGWIEPVNGRLIFDDLGPVFSVSAFFADASARASDLPTLRPWGSYGGGSGAQPVTEWIRTTLQGLGVQDVVYGSDLEPAFADDALNGDPAPLKVNHEGNWFGSSPGRMVGGTMSVRRSSSAWAVVQEMLAYMHITHLMYPYSHVFDITKRSRKISRSVTMDEATGQIYVYENYDRVEDEYEGTTDAPSVSAGQDFLESIATRPVKFYCPDTDAHTLAVFVRPSDPNGWRRLGTALMPYLTFGPVSHTGDGLLELTREATTGISTIDAGDSDHIYPGAGVQDYVGSLEKVTFIDRYDASGIIAQWMKFSIKGEAGGFDLRTAVRAHAEWLLTELPEVPIPDPPGSPGSLSEATQKFWANWDVQYPAQPNIQIDGRDAYFPTAFRNNTFAEPTDIQITHQNAAWESQAGYECVFGRGRLAFPGVESIQYGPQRYSIEPARTAMAPYVWAFKAMGI